MGNFSKVTVGIGELSINGVNVGFLKGDVVWMYKKTPLDFLTGVPQTLKGRVIIQAECMLRAPYAELSAEAVSQAIGGDAITTTAAAPVVVAFGGSPASSKTFTFTADANNPGVQSIQLDDGNHNVRTVTALVVKDPTEVTTFTVNTDYILDAVNGKVYRNPAGTIGSLATVHAAWGYTPLASKKVKLGFDFGLDDVTVDFVHTRPQDGKDVHIHMPRANASGEFNMTFRETQWDINNVEFHGIFDDTNPTEPFGFIEEEV